MLNILKKNFFKQKSYINLIKKEKQNNVLSKSDKDQYVNTIYYPSSTKE